MPWIKQGLIYNARGHRSWNKTHASVPTVDVVSDQVWRIYFASRDLENRSHTSFIDVEAENPENILYEHDSPILPLGKLGSFDDCGIMPSWIVNVKNTKYLYYIGWTQRRTVPFHNGVGLAVSHDGGKTFQRLAEGPLFGVTHREPYFTASSSVMLDGTVWRCWYLSCTKWRMINERPEAFYHIKYAESEDGIDWDRKGHIAIDFKSESEAGISRPSVLKDADCYKMWFSYRDGRDYRTDRNASYRIGYAESYDAKHWTRMDRQSGITLSDEGWDSLMIEYPHVFFHGEQKYMLYNGNGFGASGFGYARFLADK